MRRFRWLLSFAILLIATTVRDVSALDEFDSLPLQTEAKPLAVTPNVVPRSLSGLVRDRVSGAALANAIVTCWIVRDDDPFEETPTPVVVKEKWTATTDDEGAYTLTLDESVLNPGDQFMMSITAEGYSEYVGSVDLKQRVGDKLPPQTLKPIPKSPWSNWTDDTKKFNQKVAATVNGVPVLNGSVIDRYGAVFNAKRQELQDAASDGDATATPEMFEEYREEILLKELGTRIKKTILAQYFMADLSPVERDKINEQLDTLFEPEIEKLRHDLGVSLRADLERELTKRNSSLEKFKENFVLNQLAKACIQAKVIPQVRISESQILAYYESHGEEFEVPQTMDWRKVGLSIPRPTIDAIQAVKDKLEQLRLRFNAGETVSDVLRSETDQKVLYALSFEETNVASLRGLELKDQLRSSSLNVWSEVIEEREAPRAVADSVVPNANSSPSVKTLPLPVSLPDYAENPSFSEKTSQLLGFAPEEPKKNVPIGPEDRTNYYIVCVTARHEPSRKKIEEVREEIRESLTLIERKSRSRKFLDTVLAVAKVESPFAPIDLFDDRMNDELISELIDIPVEPVRQKANGNPVQNASTDPHERAVPVDEKITALDRATITLHPVGLRDFTMASE